MAKHKVQVLYITYIDVEAESEKEAEIIARQMFEEERGDYPITSKELTFTATDVEE